MSLQGSNLETTPNAERALTIASRADTVVLRQLIVNDAPLLYDLIEYDRPHLSQFGDTTAEKYPTMESVVMSIVKPQEERRTRFGIWNADQLVGSINITTDPDDRVGVIGFWVGAEHTGHNYAARATRLIVQHAFGRLGLGQLYADVVQGNEGSATTLERAGFDYAGSIKRRDGDEMLKLWCFERFNPATNRLSLHELTWTGETETNSIGFLSVKGVSDWLVKNAASVYRVPTSAGGTAYEVYKKGQTRLHFPKPGEVINIQANTPFRIIADEVMIEALEPQGLERTKLERSKISN